MYWYTVCSFGILNICWEDEQTKTPPYCQGASKTNPHPTEKLSTDLLEGTGLGTWDWV